MDKVDIFEVGPRDGLQNEARLIATADKIALVDLLSGAGFRRIEVTSFVSPKWVPQMADAAEVLAGITRAPGISYAALTPNLKGYQGARAARADEVAIFASASEGFSQANLNCSIAESLDRFAPLAEAARADGIRLRGYVSMVTDCPFDGPTPPAQVARVASALLDMGCYEVALGETIGHGTPARIRAMLETALADIPADRLAGHYHDTRGRALANIEASLELGLRSFDAAVGGLGGCPYAPGAAGNVATEAVVARLADLGLVTGIDPDRLAKAAALARGLRRAPDFSSKNRGSI
ncbi:hydroxymethylglutaryl-CoA lyase [Gemmobacter serpentinus]|uniref:hydroxymethylglutaryl-CoA lyase n=1 Tax=Gemmobacter serpentinus TaxID=2652247 RepID=UPI00124CBDAE|nr:hydroxymethylglutaryl-CoA lyase [Gemmobacter serpentinus]